MSTSLLTIRNKTLCLTDSINIPDDDTIRVISILGKARMGKSTFLNAVAKHMNPAKPVPFATQSDDDHCTRGVDYYYDQTTHTLLLDCQGLALEDSSSDPLLMLAVYLISDTIVFNERMMLQNTALKLLEPICLFTQYVDIEDVSKPVLVFRISDADLVQDPEGNLAKVMTRYNDQYQSIRDTVRNLFQSPLRIIKTDTLDKDTKAAIESGDYDTLFANQKLGFHTAIETISQTLPVGKPASVWKAMLHKIVGSVNNNQRIKSDMLDVVSLIANHEMLEWGQKLSVAQPQLFMDIPIDGLRTTYNTNVEPRIATRRTILTAFSAMFHQIPDSIKIHYYSGLEKRLSAPIDKAMNLSTQLAETGISAALINAQRNRIVTFTNKESAFIYTTITLAEFAILRTTLARYYEPVAKKYEDWMMAQEDRLQAAVEQARKAERHTLVNMSSLCQDAMKTFRTEALSIVNMNTIKNSIEMEAVVAATLKDLLANLRKNTLSKVSSALTHMPIIIEADFRDTILTMTMKNQTETSLSISHTLVKETYEGFAESIQKYEGLYVDLMIAKFMKEGEDNAMYIKRLEQELVTLRSKTEDIQGEWTRLQKQDYDLSDDPSDDPTNVVKVVVSEIAEFIEPRASAPVLLEEPKSVPLVAVKCCGWW